MAPALVHGLPDRFYVGISVSIVELEEQNEVHGIALVGGGAVSSNM